MRGLVYASRIAAKIPLAGARGWRRRRVQPAAVAQFICPAVSFIQRGVPAPPIAAERLATLPWLARALDARSRAGWLAPSLVVLILDRLRGIPQRFARLAGRIGAGGFVPRRAVAPRLPIERKPRRPNPLPQGFAWLIKLVPDAAAYG
jgi:hypothetical protein